MSHIRIVYVAGCRLYSSFTLSSVYAHVSVLHHTLKHAEDCTIGLQYKSRHVAGYP